MRLLHATLRQVRLHQQLELQFDPRFTLLGGPNEAGKSTVVEALHKVLFLKATATGRAVDEMRSRLHSGLPEVELGFEAAGARWELRKRFSGASGTCQLSSDAGLALRGAAAEEQLARLLGVDGPIEGRRHSQLPLRWAHLWVRQGEAGTNLLGSPSEAYDVEQLVQQLQQRGAAAAALESPLDRLVSEQLQARLGHDHVLRLRLQSDHRPEKASALAQTGIDGLVEADAQPRRPSLAAGSGRASRRPPFPVGNGGVSQGSATASDRHVQTKHPEAIAEIGVLPRPLWLLERPQPLGERQQRPWLQGPLTLLAGPERIETGWWDGELIQRDYFIAGDTEGVLFWIYRERLPGDGMAAGWFLQGRFG